MKKYLAALLCVLICVSLLPAALAANTREIGFEASLACGLKEIGLFRGIAGDEAEGDNFDLNRAPSRAEALTILVRALGKGEEAEAHPKTHPFSDVPAWADGVVSYAYDNGLTNGVSDTLFGAADTASAEMCLTYMLRALGYSDGEGEAFVWNAPWALAAWCGILPARVDRTDFLRADLVNVLCAALYAYSRGTQTTLHERLESEGAFTGEEFDAAFSADPFERFRLIDGRVSEAIAAKQPLGQLADNVYSNQCHIIAGIIEEGGVLTVPVLVCVGNAKLQKDGSIGSSGGGIGPWLIELDAETLETRACRTAQELAAQGLSWNDCLPGTSGNLEKLAKGMTAVCLMEARMRLEAGEIGYRQPTYEQALDKVTNYLSQVTQTLEAGPCTVLLGWLGGTPHGAYAYLYLIYKPGSAAGEGETVSLPMPVESVWGATSEPDALWLDGDGLTLRYTYYYDTPLRADIDPESGHPLTLHEAGTYSYTVDLSTGEVSLDILPHG